MRKWLATAVLMASVGVGWGEKPNPADFPLMAHVIGAENTTAGARLLVVIDGKRLKLGSYVVPGLLPLADYPAKMTDVTAKRHFKPYEKDISYDLLMPDGRAVTYYLLAWGEPIGMDSTITPPPPPPPVASSDSALPSKE